MRSGECPQQGGDAHRVQPVSVQDLLGVWAFWHEHCPLAAMLTGRVLPLWLYSLLEEVEICAHCEPARRLDIIVQAAQTHKVNDEATLLQE